MVRRWWVSAKNWSAEAGRGDARYAHGLMSKGDESRTIFLPKPLQAIGPQAFDLRQPRFPIALCLLCAEQRARAIRG